MAAFMLCQPLVFMVLTRQPIQIKHNFRKYPLTYEVRRYHHPFTS